MERVLIAGGGTGGHLYPGLAVAEIIKQKHADADVRFAGTEAGLEAVVVPKAGYPLELLAVRGMPRRKSFALLPWAFAFVKSLFQCRALFREWRPDVILGTGGYASAPPVLVGRLMRVPVVLQEQNSVPGMVTRRLSRYANEVHLNFPGARRFLSRRDHLRLTGNPLRPGIIDGNRRRACRRFELDERRKTVLVLGGSHGAATLNRAIVGAVGSISRDRPLQLLVQTGSDDLEMVKTALDGAPFPTSVHAFLNEMNDAYALADIVVCRAGAMTLSEIAACGLSSVLVPYPYATDDHQTQNAREIVDRGAAVMIPDAECDGSRLAKELDRLLGNANRLRRMASLSRASARYGGADRLADAIIAYGAQPDFVFADDESTDPEDAATGMPLDDIREQMRALADKKRQPQQQRRRDAKKGGGRGGRRGKQGGAKKGGSAKSGDAGSKRDGGRRRRGRGNSSKTAARPTTRNDRGRS